MDGVIDDLDIGSDSTRVGVVVYGNNAYLRIGLDAFSNKADLRAAAS